MNERKFQIDTYTNIPIAVRDISDLPSEENVRTFES